MAPLTYYFPWLKGDREERKRWMREFAEAGAHHIVLSSELLKAGCGDTGFLLDFARDMRVNINSSRISSFYEWNV